MSTWKVGRALRTAGFVASALSGGTALAQTSPYGIAFDLRAPGTGGKQVTVNTIGETVFLDLYVTVFGQDANPRNEALQVVSGGFRSSAGGLGGDLLGLTPVAPFDQTSRPGLQSDPDGD